MRPSRRRRPAGVPQVPTIPYAQQVVALPCEPSIVRLAPDRRVLDAVWGLSASSLALVWPDTRAAGGWARSVWPVEPASHRFVAPIDLHVGHVLEVGVRVSHGWESVYGWIADAHDRHFVVSPSPSAAEAAETASRAFEVWRVSELARVEDAWRARFARVFAGNGRVS